MDEKNTTGRMEVKENNTAQTIQKEINWFESVVDTRLTLYFRNKSEFESIYSHTPPEIVKDSSAYAKFIKDYNLTFEDRLVLILAFIPYIKPQSLGVFLIKNQNLNSEFSGFGGYKNPDKAGFLPTLETACFLLAGSDLNERLKFIKTLDKNHLFYRKGILEEDTSQDYFLYQKLKISNEYLGLFTKGKKDLPDFNSKFPAKEITTKQNWDDLIVEQNVMENLTEIKEWLLHSDLILKDWKLGDKIKSGYRVLFYGSPGTGKTLAATLLGKKTNRRVFRVDFSLVVSKYIGETEKNLGRLFDEAENKDWILFFDEADALFGKRSQTKDTHDRYANQEVAYLLQRIEEFSGLIILATNMQGNIDQGFSRRFQSMIHFAKPDKKQRKILWKNLFKGSLELESSIDLDELSEKYELTGGEMINVLRYCALEAAKRNEKLIESKDLIRGIRREYRKLHKTI